VAQRPPSPEVEPVSSFCFPPGLIPQLVRDKQRWADAYAPIELRDIEEAGLPPPPHKDAYLKSRIDKFLTEVSVALWWIREGFLQKPSQERCFHDLWRQLSS
jgi:hypothetical protein